MMRIAVAKTKNGDRRLQKQLSGGKTCEDEGGRRGDELYNNTGIKIQRRSNHNNREECLRNVRFTVRVARSPLTRVRSSCVHDGT